ncbi:FecR family protein [Dyadobacter sp. CY261]|uniref:FecR family protein n=1 Tax=Dyadobacter sp. CY261 TaxID=2907203 RepID=UPI001F42A266|nr:FecR family protein [Dyadobacter sp. CY261]MCF0071728.1 FecR family protein [Dyadobacter sp. CY261]
MNHQDLQTLLLKYRQGKCSPEEVDHIHKWYESLNAGSELALDEQEKQQLQNKLWAGIHGEMQEPEILIHPETTRSRAFPFSVFSGVAAAVLLALAYVFFFTKKDAVTKPETSEVLVAAPSGKLLTFVNKQKMPQAITLDDQSKVILAPGTEVIYPEHFPANKREIQVKGIAFFEVTKDSRRPFCVYSGKLVTRVLGTSFWVKTQMHNSNSVEVEVVSGKVSVFENRKVLGAQSKGENVHGLNNGVILTPNQRVTYFEESGHLMTSLVEKPVPIVHEAAPAKVVFNNESITSIAEHLRNEYGVDIVLAADQLEKCTFTGDLSDMGLFDKLDLICKSNHASYEVKGTRILISGEGCD